MAGWRCWVCRECKIVSYHHVTYCPMCPNLFEFESGTDLKERFPCSYAGDEYTPYEWWGKAFEHKQPWCNTTDEQLAAMRPIGPPRPTDTRERQTAWYKKNFPTL